jgi:hypothetical protein
LVLLLHFPCPICLVNRKDLLLPSFPRTSFTVDTHSQKHPPLLTISPDRIVPLPLHLFFLGIGNKIIKDVLIDEFDIDNKQLQKSIKSVKTIHSHRSSGVSAVHTLNGIELSKWIKIIYNFIPSIDTTPSELLTIIYWLQELKLHLLHNNIFTKNNLNEFSSLVEHIQTNWEGIINNKLIPKIHMLSHAIEFIKQHNYLGLYSESPIEHSHYMFNNLYRHTHYNMGGKNNCTQKLK